MARQNNEFCIWMSHITCLVSGSHEGAGQLVEGLDTRKASVFLQLSVQELQEGVRCASARVAARSTLYSQKASLLVCAYTESMAPFSWASRNSRRHQ